MSKEQFMKTLYIELRRKRLLYYLDKAKEFLEITEDGELALGGTLENNPAPTITETIEHIISGLSSLYEREKEL